MTNEDNAFAFEPLDDGPGIEIVDRVEQERCQFRTTAPVSPTATETDAFRFPVDRAAKLEVEGIALPNVAAILVRDESGEIVSQIEQLHGESFKEGVYTIELLTQFKTYLEVESAVEISSGLAEFHLEFGQPTEVTIGALSNHERPVATISTTEDPTDMMAAVETFGSSLKTMAPDRSLPSLRGHPPAVELGSELHIPDSIHAPDTGVRLELPPRPADVFVAAPLVYYLGASVEPGSTPRLVTDCGFEYPLSGRQSYHELVEQTLKQVFFFDCITRTEGFHPVNLHERQEVEQVVDLDFGSLYERPLAEQVQAYLDVPYAVIEDHVPEWKLTTHVEPVPETIEQLPFVVDDLAIVRTETPATSQSSVSQPEVAGLSRNESFTRSAEAQQSEGVREEYVEPLASGSMEQAWIGQNIPIGASKLTKEAFENRFDRTPSEGDISIKIVVNDSRMSEERDLVDRAYDNRQSLPFDVDVFQDVTVERLRDLLEEDTTFFHYIGHTEQDGFECSDGKLDATALEESGVQAFLLNACSSYGQGLGLIEAGGIGGIVTLNDVLNEGAVNIGETVARLLNAGFPLRASLTIARDESVLGGQYIVVGDGGMTVAQAESGVPVLANVSPTEGGYSVSIETYTTDVHGLGSMFKPNIQTADKCFLSSGQISTFHMSEPELAQFLTFEEMPVRMDGALHWSSDIRLEQFDF